ncbi:MAG: hypothetical protein GY953_08530, partial [bacterium]|nr:hypothetical protein [bacterium]
MTAWSATAGSPRTRKDLEALADHLRPKMASWRDNVPQLTVTGSANTRVALVPTITAQYDKSKIMKNNKTTRWARSKEDFQACVRVARDNLDPNGVAGSGEQAGDKLVWIQTLNEWPEGTTIEPTELGEDYPYSDPEYRHNYGFEFLEA